MASEEDPDGWEAFRDDRAWHYAAGVDRYKGELQPLTISIRFPYTDPRRGRSAVPPGRDQGAGLTGRGRPGQPE